MNNHEIQWTLEKAERLWAFYGSRPWFASQYFARNCGHRIISLLNSLVDVKGTIIDFGCGPGYLLKHLESCPDWKEYIGIDSSEESMKKLLADNSSRDRVIRTLSIAGVDAGIKDMSGDLALCIEVIEHCTDDDLKKFFLSVRRMMKSGSHMLLTTPNSENLEKNKRLCPECGCVYHMWQHIRTWTPEDLSKMLADNGFSSFDIFSVDFAVDTFGFTAFERLVLKLKFGSRWCCHNLSKQHLVALVKL